MLSGLLGENGCGKTTLLRIIAGLETQTAGQILQNGKDVSWLPPDRLERRMGFFVHRFATHAPKWQFALCESLPFEL